MRRYTIGDMNCSRKSAIPTIFLNGRATVSSDFPSSYMEQGSKLRSV